MINDNKLTDLTKEQISPLKIENGQIIQLKPSQLPLMSQVSI
jgi:hypothetical protein